MKKTTLELTLSPEYVQNWGIWEAVRELIQNGQDAHELGHPVIYTYIPKSKKLLIVNSGTTVDRSMLLLGTSTKRDNADQRGQWGEGFKLAWLVLLRSGLDIWVKSGDERWVPRIEQSDKFKSEILKVDVAPVSYKKEVRVEIKGLNPRDWEMIKDNTLFISKPNEEDVIKTPFDGQILIHTEAIGKLYAHGLFVNEMDGNYKYGYDLKAIDLDRDRKLANPYSLKYKIAATIGAAVKHGLKVSEVYDLMMAEYTEAEAIETYPHTSGLQDVLYTEFVNRHGENVIPVDSLTAQLEAGHMGVATAIVSNPLVKVLSPLTGTIEDGKKKRGLEAARVYSVDDLTEEEMKNFLWALELVMGMHNSSINVVDFVNEKIAGRYQFDDESVMIAKKLLADRKELLVTLVHEIAHIAGTDGTREHIEKISTIFADIVIKQEQLHIKQ